MLSTTGNYYPPISADSFTPALSAARVVFTKGTGILDQALRNAWHRIDARTMYPGDPAGANARSMHGGTDRGAPFGASGLQQPQSLCSDIATPSIRPTLSAVLANSACVKYIYARQSSRCAPRRDGIVFDCSQMA